MTIKELKQELNLSNADLAKCFNMTYGAYANSTAKERYENALLNFYKLAKKGWKKNKTKNLISDNQTIKDEPEQLIIHGVSNQRELLFAYEKSFESENISDSDIYQTIDSFLSK